MDAPSLTVVTVLQDPKRFVVPVYPRTWLRLSLLRLNQEIAREEQWDEGAIRRRAARLADLAVTVWTAPQATP